MEQDDAYKSKNMISQNIDEKCQKIIEQFGRKAEQYLVDQIQYALRAGDDAAAEENSCMLRIIESKR